MVLRYWMIEVLQYEGKTEKQYFSFNWTPESDWTVYIFRGWIQDLLHAVGFSVEVHSGAPHQIIK